MTIISAGENSSENNLNPYPNNHNPNMDKQFSEEELMKNHFEISGHMTVIYLPIKNGGFHETLISTSDLERVDEFPNGWYSNYTDEVNSRYVKGSVSINGVPKKIYLHRWIMNPLPGLKVDHINHDTLDNQRGNLRICTNAENMRNRKSHHRNKSGVLGVHWDSRWGKWVATAVINGKQTYLGGFDKIEDATSSRKKAESQHYGEFI